MLEKLFVEHGFAQVQVADDNLSVYQYSQSQFYFVAEYVESEFLDYEDSHITEAVINLYSSYQKDNPVITKNSAMIILLKCDGHSPSEELLNKIYAVEEDPFGMRKYVVVAESEIIEQLKSISYDDLTKIALNKGRFDKYQKNVTTNDDHEYMGAIQIYIKLPFLRMRESKEELQTISELVDSLMKKDGNSHIKDQTIGKKGSIFDDRERFISDALSLEKNEIDDWLDQTLEGVK